MNTAPIDDLGTLIVVSLAGLVVSFAATFQSNYSVIAYSNESSGELAAPGVGSEQVAGAPIACQEQS